MSWWGKNDKEEEQKAEPKPEIVSLCPYCESKIEILTIKEAFAKRETDDYEWSTRMYLCPFCKKIISVQNFE